MSSDHTDQTYYAYCVDNDENSTPKQAFIKNALKARGDDVRRGATELIELHGDDHDSLIVEILDSTPDEVEAWMLRNDYRASDPSAITGVTSWPATHSREANVRDPDRVAGWRIKSAINRCKTTREAFRLGAFEYRQFQQLGVIYGKDVIKHDMDNLNAMQFSEKYGVPINYDC